jgi:hypothetical protein
MPHSSGLPSASGITSTAIVATGLPWTQPRMKGEIDCTHGCAGTEDTTIESHCSSRYSVVHVTHSFVSHITEL